MTDAFRLPFVLYAWNKKETLAEILAFYQITASHHVQVLKKLHCGKLRI